MGTGDKTPYTNEALDPLLLKLASRIDRQMDPDLYPKKITIKKNINFNLLSTEQKNVLDMVTVEGKSVFFTGAAGTGKSFLLKAIIQKISVGLANSSVVTATTGIAACNIGGYCDKTQLWLSFFCLYIIA